MFYIYDQNVDTYIHRKDCQSIGSRPGAERADRIAQGPGGVTALLRFTLMTFCIQVQSPNPLRLLQ